MLYKNTAFAIVKTLRHSGCSIFTCHLWWIESFVLKHKSTTSQYSQTWVNDHIRITTNCLQRPPFLGSLCNIHIKKLPLVNDHLTTTTAGLTVHTTYMVYNDASDIGLQSNLSTTTTLDNDYPRDSKIVAVTGCALLRGSLHSKRGIWDAKTVVVVDWW